MQGCPQLTVHIALRRLSGRHDGLSFLEVIKEMFVDEVDENSKMLASRSSRKSRKQALVERCK